MSQPRTVRAPRGTQLTCKSWLTEAPYRMIQNNLDPEVAERPQDLVVYGGRGQAARNWEAFDAILAALKELEDEGIITRKIDATAFPVKTEYTLTESGLEIVSVIRGIKHWALKWKIDNIPCGEQDCKVCVL